MCAVLAIKLSTRLSVALTDSELKKTIHFSTIGLSRMRISPVTLIEAETRLKMIPFVAKSKG